MHLIFVNQKKKNEKEIVAQQTPTSQTALSEPPPASPQIYREKLAIIAQKIFNDSASMSEIAKASWQGIKSSKVSIEIAAFFNYMEYISNIEDDLSCMALLCWLHCVVFQGPNSVRK